mgnify:CR=1 FL=1
MKILSLDSSATCASVALFDIESQKIIGDFFINTKLTHSQTLVPMLDALLKSTKTELSDIDYFAVNTGPGSFTGVRIGVAAVKGMAMALNKPCVAVSTLDSMAYNLLDVNCTAVCVMDARCNQVYNANFKVDNGNVEKLCDDRALSIDELTDELKSVDGHIVLVGDGAKLCFDKMKDAIPNIKIASIQNRYQKASSTALVALNLYNNGKTLTAEELMPYYLRLPQAERELKKREESGK